MPLKPHERHAIGFLLRHLAVGLGGGALVGTLLLYHDSYGLWSMMKHSGHTVLSVFLLFFGLFITFGSVGMAVGVMGLGDYRDRDPREDGLD